MTEIYLKFCNREYTPEDEMCSLFSELLNSDDDKNVIVYRKEILNEEYILHLKNNTGMIKSFTLLNDEIYYNIVENKSSITIVDISNYDEEGDFSFICGTVN